MNMYSRGMEGNMATKVIVNEAGEVIAIDIWSSVGLGLNRTGSYALVHIQGNPVTGRFEMTTGGLGIGFSGATLCTDGNSMNVTASADPGQNTTSQCVDATTITESATCSTESNTFLLYPLGIEAGFFYPTSCAQAGQPSCDDEWSK